MKSECDHSFKNIVAGRGIFLYPSEPRQIASTIETAVGELNRRDGGGNWSTWKDLQVGGKIIFCEICKRMRFSDVIITDVTTMNFNLMFEIGYALGLNLPLIPIRDTSYLKDKYEFDELGLLDTVGYVDFQNSDHLVQSVLSHATYSALSVPQVVIDFERPLYVIKGHLNTEGEIRLLSTLKKSAAHFKTYDVVETPRASLYEVQKNVASSLGVVAHLLDPARAGAKVHNARCALISGMAMALGKPVLMLQEGNIPQPIDYRSLVHNYLDPDEIKRKLEPVIKQLLRQLQTSRLRNVKPPAQFLHKLDLGDVAAENESSALDAYFVESGQFIEAKRGHARIISGRKGSGKTAIFYAVRSSIGRSKNWTVLDLKPEGHQFTKLRETVLSKLGPGAQEHTVAAFWKGILLAELAHKIIEDDISWAQGDGGRFMKYEAIKGIYERSFGFAGEGDFSERLLNQVDRLAEEFTKKGEPNDTRKLTEIIFRGEVRDLEQAVSTYLGEKEEVWLLIDNLDKGWPVHGASEQDIMILRALLESTRKIQKQLERKGVDFHCLVFIRNDIFDHLIMETPDRGKDTAILVDCDDPEFFKEMFRLRVLSSADIEGDASTVWLVVFDPYVDTEDSYKYLVNRTLMRPRDFLNYVHRCIEVAINRGHNKVGQDDIRHAERSYSNDMLKSLMFELKDIHQEAQNVLCEYLGCKVSLTYDEVYEMISLAGVEDDKIRKCIELLVWFGFLGVRRHGVDEPRYSYDTAYDVARLMHVVDRKEGSFEIHPAFRSSLECSD